MIRTEIKENVGVIYLDRPKQLNSLNLEMIRGIRENLEKWEEDENIRAVLFDSKSEKGFSAGGDLKEMYYDFLTNEDCTDKDQFFVEEFGLDKYINQFKKPIISHWYGIVMGGGDWAYNQFWLHHSWWNCCLGYAWNHTWFCAGCGRV